MLNERRAREVQRQISAALLAQATTPLVLLLLPFSTILVRRNSGIGAARIYSLLGLVQYPPWACDYYHKRGELASQQCVSEIRTRNTKDKT